ncbi:MAG: Glu/Leu/Phe/Val dehydrogenase dimerization domain-containing protein [Eubacteriales bacterium]|nr:Glu/Leu/Phe/Val dehydrogenase dimerization domain-containing protein [Eubacteriales bacterium]
MKRDPYLVIEWSDRKSDARGWLVVDSIADEKSAGGLRMSPTVNRTEVERLAQVMTYKYVAAEAVSGGSKAGIVYDCHKEDHLDVLRRFLEAMRPYTREGVTIGADLGTNPDDIRAIKKELGIEDRLAKSVRDNPERAKKANENLAKLAKETVDGLSMDRLVTGFGVAQAADQAWKKINGAQDAKVSIQGFGSVGGSCARYLQKMGYKVVAISDINGMYYNEEGLDIQDLLDARNLLGEVDVSKMKKPCEVRNRDEWLGLDVDIVIPAAVEDIINKDTARTVKASLIVEGANIPTTEEADVILHEMGVHIVPDFIANQGSICYFTSIQNAKCEATPEGVMERLSDVIRRGVDKTFDYAQKNAVTEREAAWTIFKANN